MKKSQPAVLQAEEKRARNSVPKCPCKLLQPADRPMAGSSSLEGHFGTGLRARYSSAWSNVGCGRVKSSTQPYFCPASEQQPYT